MKIAEVLSLIVSIVTLGLVITIVTGCADTKPFRIDSIEYGAPSAVEEVA